MSNIQERLQQLLDGELDPADIADDPTLVSLADRIYGIKIASVQPVKARDLAPRSPTGTVTEIAPPTDMMVEVIAPEAPALELPLPTNPLPEIDMPATATRQPNTMRWIFTAGLLVSILNLLGVFGYLFGGLCDPSDICPSDGSSRINWASIHQITTGYGWSPSVLDGSFGIPDIVAVVSTSTLMVFFTRRK